MRTPNLRHVRHKLFERIRRSKHLLEWVNAQATRIGVSAQALWAMIQAGSSAAEIEGTASASIPANTVVPTITGTPKVGTALTASTGTWSGSPAPTYAYQWKVAGVNAGTNSNTYTPVAGDATKTVTVTVTATNSAGSASATSAATAAVAA